MGERDAIELLEFLREQFKEKINGTGYSDVSDEDLRDWIAKIDVLVAPIPKPLCACGKEGTHYRLWEDLSGYHRADFCNEHWST